MLLLFEIVLSLAQNNLQSLTAESINCLGLPKVFGWFKAELKVMANEDWFSNLPKTIGELSPEEKALKLQELNRSRGSSVPTRGDSPIPTLGTANSFRKKPWNFTNHKFGYISLTGEGNSIAILDASNLNAENTLKNTPLRITLDRFRVEEYPGWGRHRILINFWSKYSQNKAYQQMHFNQAVYVGNNNLAPIRSIPVFTGLRVESEELVLGCYTVNVKNQSDEAFLNFLESPVVRGGLLLSNLHPTLGLFSQTAVEIAKSIAGRFRNVAVQKFEIGLNFSGHPVHYKLRTGSYIAIQAPGDSASWNWNDWVYNINKGEIVRRGLDQPMPYNYLVFSISRYEGE